MIHSILGILGIIAAPWTIIFKLQHDWDILQNNLKEGYKDTLSSLSETKTSEIRAQQMPANGWSIYQDFWGDRNEVCFNKWMNLKIVLSNYHCVLK